MYSAKYVIIECHLLPDSEHRRTIHCFYITDLVYFYLIIRYLNVCYIQVVEVKCFESAQNYYLFLFRTQEN